MPTISVIIPAYNRAVFLKEALESVFAQTYTNYEVIVIDDGSTDNTEDVVSKLLAEQPETADKVRYIKQANAGVSAARNHGIFEASGEWIAFLDSDDLWFPEKLEKQMAFLDEHPTAGAVCGLTYHYQDGQIQKNKDGMILYHPHPLDRATSVLPFELFATQYYVDTCSVLVRKTVLYKAGLFECGIKIGEDFCLWVKIAKFTEFWFLSDVLGYRRNHDTNTYGSSALETLFYDRMIRQLQMVRWSSEPHIVKLYEQWFLIHYGSCAYRNRKERNYKEAASSYWSAAWYAHGLKTKGRLFVKFLIAKFFPFVFWIWDKRRDSR